jgi:hypothetical protein
MEVHVVKPTDKSLKDQNRLPLISVVLANVLILYLLSQTASLQIEGAMALLKNWIAAVPAGVIFAITSVITEFFDAPMKARLVFWRWTDPLPGARAFSVLVYKDPRIDIAALRAKIGELPTSPREQNSLWYKLYLAVQNDTRVVQVN